jgi:hypothetical protein
MITRQSIPRVEHRVNAVVALTPASGLGIDEIYGSESNTAGTRKATSARAHSAFGGIGDPEEAAGAIRAAQALCGAAAAAASVMGKRKPPAPGPGWLRPLAEPLRISGGAAAAIADATKQIELALFLEARLDLGQPAPAPQPRNRPRR